MDEASGSSSTIKGQGRLGPERVRSAGGARTDAAAFFDTTEKAACGNMEYATEADARNRHDEGAEARPERPRLRKGGDSEADSAAGHGRRARDLTMVDHGFRTHGYEAVYPFAEKANLRPSLPRYGELHY